MPCGSYSAAPAMIGDFFGGSFQFGSEGAFNEVGQGADEGSSAPTISLAGGDRRFKIAENVSPVPRDRFFFNYNHFENALKDFRGRSVSLDRYAFRLEKTFFDELTSVEIRLPEISGLNSTQDFDSDDTRGGELSNLSIALKAISLSGERWLISGGTTLALPTGNGYIEAFRGNNLLLIDHDAVQLAPFIGWLVTPNDRWFAQGFLQTDFDLNGNRVRIPGLGTQGILRDQNLLFADVSVGHWLMQSSDRPRRLRGDSEATPRLGCDNRAALHINDE